VIPTLAAIGAALATGFASAVFPLVNGEAAALALGALKPAPTAWMAVAALAVGQTAGKVLIYQLARQGRSLGARWSRRRQGKVADVGQAPAVQTAQAPGLEAQTPGSEAEPSGGRWQRAGRRLLALMDGRWRCAAVVAASASVGLPPLLATAALAGAIRMRRADFIVVCLAGRLARFMVLAWPVVAATH
jgi:membrane protein YqaA with SNARE-associated domain